MVATVRIAPIERWCQYAIDAQDDAERVADYLRGKSIRILTHTMSIAPDCGGRAWTVEATSDESLTEGCGGTPDGIARHICEHMLEMD